MPAIRPFASKEKLNLSKFFGSAIRGLSWAALQIPGGRLSDNVIEIGDRSLSFERSKIDLNDGYTLKHDADGMVTAKICTPLGGIGALIDLASRVRPNPSQDYFFKPRFKTRLYKQEITFEGQGTVGRPAITSLTDRFIESFFRELARRRFNAVVFYCGYHPFEYFLDYADRPHYTNQPAESRARNFCAFRKILDTAHAYGIRTFFQHYVSHFTQALSDHLNLGLKAQRYTRLANFDHPKVHEYCRYIYQRTLDTLPSLDGFFLNFESCGNPGQFLKKSLFHVTRDRAHKPTLLFRLWGISDLEGMSKTIRSYNGPTLVKHKPHDTCDGYYYPAADDRVRVWKRALPVVLPESDSRLISISG